MADGYSGKDFLAGLAEDWDVVLRKPVKQEMPDGRMRTYIHGSGPDGIFVSAGYADHRNISSLICTSESSGDVRFLDACTELDVAGLDHRKAHAWFDKVKKRTDRRHEREAAQSPGPAPWVVSDVLTSGPVILVLDRANRSYRLRILGRAAR
ncbi:hypothetical protein ABT026_03725 [Streptomyces sp. NPDC002734]|uniref:hypothetical protein n=1 Tax=Streptomyces sp. NPDC002734 TaxID=3154426 RepID=UPI00332AFD32